MNIEQEAKYKIADGKLVNRKTGIPIPDDEPLFIFRAKDLLLLLLLDVLEFYKSKLQENTIIMDIVNKKIKDCTLFKEQHPDRMKIPD